MNKPSKYAKVAWTEFKPAHLPPVTEETIQRMAKEANLPVERVRGSIEAMNKDEVIVMNSLYQVNIRKLPPPVEGWPDILHLSIKRRDKAVIHDWRDLQRIKNEVVGPECEAIELYPAESRLVDSANQYHLWVFHNPQFRFPVGWHERLVRNNSPHGGKQRPFRE